ncbi:MAG: hypothetical protein P1U89_13115 [Verrucomicrobiales bacterium]|nr:hypothetical protein [Verrucomicrobiales bacterium]
MKIRNLLILGAACITTFAVSCKDGNDTHDHSGHDHDHAGHDHDHGHDHAENKTNVREAGPNGGRILHDIEPHLEFLVTSDRKIQITALDDSLKPTSLGSQVIRITGGDRSSPIPVNLVKQGNVYLSEKPLPPGDDFPMVVQVRADESAKAEFEKFTLDMSPCPTCDYLEYACTCDHGHDHGHDHDHDHKH